MRRMFGCVMRRASRISCLNRSSSVGSADSDLAPQRLDRDDVVEVAVVRAVDDAHAAAAEHSLDLVAGREELADHGLAPGARRGGDGGPRHGLGVRRHRHRQRRDVLLEGRLLAELLEHRAEGAREDADLVVGLDGQVRGVEVADADLLGRAHEAADAAR